MLSHTYTLAVGTLLGLGFFSLGATSVGLSPYDDLDVAAPATECSDHDEEGYEPTYEPDVDEDPPNCMGVCMSECQMDCTAACEDAQDVGKCRCECAHDCPDICAEECSGELDVLYDPESDDPDAARTCSVADASNVGTTSGFAVLGLFAILGLRRKRD